MSNGLLNRWAELLTECNNALKGAGDALANAIDAIPAVSDFQKSYVKQQALSVASVAFDVHLLVANAQYMNVLGLCRIGFESRINLYAAMRVPEFAAQKYLAGIKGHIEELEEMIKNGAVEPTFQRELASYRHLLAEMRHDFGGMKEKPWWKLQDVVKAANLVKEYEEHYSMLSKAVHNTPTGLATKADPHILTGGIINLLNDVTETCAALVFFRETDSGSRQFITTLWKETIAAIDTYQSAYGGFRNQASELLKEEFGL